MNINKDITINMPQMALEALSENWLFKELGAMHWDLICHGLSTKSFDLKNDTDDRLYATFVRIRLTSEKNLSHFIENDAAAMDGSIARFGNSMYFSKIDFKTSEVAFHNELMTTFSIRNHGDNTKLAKSEPHNVDNQVENLSKLPAIGSEYRLIKKRVLKELNLGNFKFTIDYDQEPIFTHTYALNPFIDLNGVNLLYFAAYPIINDVCESKYFNEQLDGSRWEQTYYTSHKDILYYSNCNINERIKYELLTAEKQGADYLVSSLLRRESDNEILARVFTVKSPKREIA